MITTISLQKQTKEELSKLGNKSDTWDSLFKKMMRKNEIKKEGENEIRNQ